MPEEGQFTQNLNQQPPATPQPPSSNNSVKYLLLGILGLALLGGSAFAGYYYGVQQVQPAKKSTTPVVSQPTPKPTPTPTLTPVVEDETKDWKTYTDGRYGFKVRYYSSWQVKSFSSKDDYYNVTKSGVSFEKNGYKVTIINLGKIPESGCGALIRSEGNFKKIEGSDVDLWRPKIEEGKIDGMVAINPQGAEFVLLNLGIIESLQNKVPEREGNLDCNFSVGTFRYEVKYQLPIIGQENLKNIDPQILLEMDDIVSSISWAE